MRAHNTQVHADTTVGITGSDGLIGWHLRCYLHATRPNYKIVPCNRADFQNKERLQAIVDQCDVLVHLAAKNRGEDSDVTDTNIGLAEDLVDALSRTGRRPQLFFSSSTHSNGDSAYGRSKRRCTEIFSKWAATNNAAFTNLVLPHIFGECGRPFYNSVVSTFCHQLANGQESVVNGDNELELIHAQDVARLILDGIERQTAGDIRPPGTKLGVSQLYARLAAFSSDYANGIIPDVRKDIDLRLFNTYRSFVFPEGYPVSLQLRSDNRGSLFEAVKTAHGGQAFLSTTKPGVTRGEHFHFRKIERFLVIGGEALIRIRRLFDEKIHEFRVSGENPAYIDMPTLHTHNITNIGDAEMVTLFWSNEIFDPDNSDTYAETVANGKTWQ